MPGDCDADALTSLPDLWYAGVMPQTARAARMGIASHRDLWRAPDDGNRWEIIDGEVQVSPAPAVSHQDAVFALARMLAGHVERRRLGRVFIAPLGVVLGQRSAVQPDIVFVARRRSAIIHEKGIFGAPDLIVEVLSGLTASRDRVMKRDLYARSGVAHYWLVDPRKQTLQALRLDGPAYAIEAEVGPRGLFRPALFPGLTIRLRAVFAR